MERVAFLIEDSGERLRCLLNPDSLVVRRLAGVQARKSLGGRVGGGASFSDDPLVYSGGGTTELTLDLLFDTALSGSSIESENVRELTAPLWQLAENAASSGSMPRPPLVRFIWGKTWNIPGVVTAVSERFEHFDSEGSPRRSWLRLRLIRVAEHLPEVDTDSESLHPALHAGSFTRKQDDAIGIHEMIGGATSEERGGEVSLSDIAFQRYGNAAYWRVIAWANNLADPLHVPAGFPLKIPSVRGEAV